MPVEKSLVNLVYQVMLGRAPESQTVIDEHAAKCGSLENLLSGVLSSREFQHRSYSNIVENYYTSTLPKVNVDVTNLQMAELIDRVRRGWQLLGESDPYWSVLTNEAFRSYEINEATLKEFFATGAASANLINRFEVNAQTKVEGGTCFELGCGVGRVTYHLSRRFEKVIAADISEGNLAICKSHLTSLGVKNVEFLLVKSLDDFNNVARFDFLYSIIVLQHNPPPIQQYMLDVLTSKIRDKGACLFQTPATIPDYEFEASNYLNSPTTELEMHALPMHVVMNVLQKNGLAIKLVIPDQFTGWPGSYTYFAAKK